MAKKTANAALIADRYAAALFPLAEKSGALDQVSADLTALAELMGKDEHFRHLAASPVIAPEAKAKIVESLLGGWKATPLVIRLLSRAAKAGRLTALPEMAEAFARLRAEANNEMTVRIISAKPLTEAQTNALTQAAGAGSGKKIQAEVTLDPSLIAGVIIEAGAKRLDRSLSGSLKRIKAALSPENTHSPLIDRTA